MPSLDWKRLDSRYIVRDEWFTLRADIYRLPDERVIEPVYVIEYRDWVNVVALTPAQEVVLVRQFRPGLGRIVLELPGGTRIRAKAVRWKRRGASCWKRPVTQAPSSVRSAPSHQTQPATPT